MQIITVTGNVGKDPEVRTIASGDKVCSVNVGSKQGWGENASTNWFRCSVWGKRADTVAEYVRKGSKVTVTGEFSTRDYEGKTQLEIRVNDIDWAKLEGASPRQSSGGGVAAKPALDSDLDDDPSDWVPF